MQRAFSLAFKPQPHLALGLCLEPLTLGHVFLLASIDSPFLIGGQATLVDLSDAVLICSDKWRQAEKTAGKWWFPVWLKMWAFKCRNCDWQQESGRFQTYYDEQTEFPIAKKVKEGGQLASPWWVRLMAQSLAELHLTEEVAMDKTVSKLAALLAAHYEAEGKADYVNQNDEDFASVCDELDARDDLEFPARAE